MAAGNGCKVFDVAVAAAAVAIAAEDGGDGDVSGLWTEAASPSDGGDVDPLTRTALHPDCPRPSHILTDAWSVGRDAIPATFTNIHLSRIQIVNYKGRKNGVNKIQ